MHEGDVLDVDLLILGGGPAGYAAAVTAGKLGVNACLVERAELGGTCLNRGCIPTKLLLGATEAICELEAQSRLGTLKGEIRVEPLQLLKRKNTLISATRKALGVQLSKVGLGHLSGLARIADNGVVEVSSGESKSLVRYKGLIIAVGSSPAVVPGFEPDGRVVLDSDMLLELEEAPKSLAVIGSGAIGLEMSQIFNRMGSKITLIELMPEIAPAEDAEVSRELNKIFRRRGWHVITGKRVEEIVRNDTGAVLRLNDGASAEADKVLVAVGRRPNTSGLGLENLGVTPNKGGWIGTDKYLMAAPGVYAVGDVNGRVLLAHVASHQAEYAVRHFAGGTASAYPAASIPSCIYGDPETMRVGIMAGEAKARGWEVKVSRYRMIANPIAQAHGSTHGFIKVVWRDGRIIGITGVGFRVSHLLSLAGVIVDGGWKAEKAEEMIFPHPTLEECVKEAICAPLEDN